MTARKPFFLRAIALVTAVLLIITGIMNYSFAHDEGDNALVLNENENITDFYVIIKDSNGKGVITGRKQNTHLKADEKDPMRAEDVTSVSLIFKWKAQKFTDQQIKKLQETDGLIKYHIGEIKGFDVVGIGSDKNHPAVSNNDDYNASYWIEGEHLYIRLDAGAYDRSNHYGGFTFAGELDLQKIDNNKGKLQIGQNIEYQFDTSSQLGIFSDKSAVGYVQWDNNEKCYYQEFQVVVGSTKGSARDVYLEEYLTDWFDGIYDVKIKKGGTDTSYNNGAFIPKADPIVIKIGDTPENKNSWRDYNQTITVTYRAKLNAKVDKNELLKYNNYGYGEDGKNTVKAKSDVDNVESGASAWIYVPTPVVNKTGTLSPDGQSITWRITVKPTDMFGNDFTLSDKFGENTYYINMEEYYKCFQYNGALALDKSAIRRENGEYYIEFTTPLQNLDYLKENITITNTLTVQFKNVDEIERSASVTIYVPKPKSDFTKTLTGYQLYDSEKGIDTNTFTWNIDYTVPEDVRESNKLKNECLYIYDLLEENAVVSKNKENIKITDGEGEDIDFDIDFNGAPKSYEFAVFIKDPVKYIGQTIHITYQSEIGGNKSVSYVKNTVVRFPNQETTFFDQYFPTYTTHKAVSQSTEKDCVADWVVYIKSNVGYQPGDEVEITDILPEGLTLVEDSVYAGYKWGDWGNFDSFTDSNGEILDSGMFYTSSSSAEGGRKYTFSFTVPDGWDKGKIDDKTVYLAVKYKTKLADADTYTKVASGTITAFTNYASATVTRDEPKKADPGEETFIPNLNKNGELLSKIADLTGITIPDYAANSSDIPDIPYVITVNSERAKLSVSDNENITLADTMEKHISLSEKKPVTVTKVNADGTTEVVENCWEYNEALKKLTFTLKDETKYIIKYYVAVNFPTKEEDDLGLWERADYYNTAKLIIDGRDSFTSVEQAGWVKAIQRGFYDSNNNVKYKYADLSITKTWADTSDYAHDIEFKLTWKKYSYNGDVFEKSGEKEAFNIRTDENGHTFTIKGLPAEETDSNGTRLSYYVYTLKETAVDGNSLEGVYDADYGSDGVVINCKNLDFNSDTNTAEISKKIVNTYKVTGNDPQVPDSGGDNNDDNTITITLNKVWNDGDSQDHPEITFKLERKTEDTEFALVEGVKPSQNDNTYIFADLPKSDDKGKVYTYRVTEEILTSEFKDSYTAAYNPSNLVSGADGNITVTNTPTGTTDSGEETDPGTPELTIVKTQSVNGEQPSDKQKVQPGDAVTYCIKITNTGTAAAKNVVVTDDIPNGNPGDVALELGPIGGDCTSYVDGNKVVWKISELGIGASAEVSFTVTVPEVDKDTIWKNIAMVSFENNPKNPDPPTDSDDPHKGRMQVLSNEVEIGEFPEPSTSGTPDLTVEKTQSVNSNAKTKEKQTVKPGDAVTYYIKITNKGTAAAKDVVVTDDIPNGLTLSSIGSSGSRLADGRTIEWNIGEIETGDENAVTVSFTVTVPRVDVATTWTNIAKVSFGNNAGIFSNRVEIEGKPDAKPSPAPPATSNDNFNIDDDGLPRGDQDLSDGNDNFNIDDDGLPRGDQNLPDGNDYFNIGDDGLPRGDHNLPTGVVLGGSAFIAVGTLILSAVALSAGKLKRSKKNK